MARWLACRPDGHDDALNECNRPPVRSYGKGFWRIDWPDLCSRIASAPGKNEQKETEVTEIVTLQSSGGTPSCSRIRENSGTIL